MKSSTLPRTFLDRVCIALGANLLFTFTPILAGTVVPVDLPAVDTSLTELSLPVPVGTPILNGFDPLTFEFTAPRFLVFETGARPNTLLLNVNLSTTGGSVFSVPATFSMFDAEGQVAHFDDTQMFGQGSDFGGSAEIPLGLLSERAFHAVSLGIDGRDLQGELPGSVTGGTITLSVENSVLGRLRVAASRLEGDYNDNGVVDAADYVVWRNSTNMTGANLPADGNGDDTIGKEDYTIWVTNFGRTVNTGSSTAVPEPSVLGITATLVIFALSPLQRGLFLNRWTRRGSTAAE